MPAVAYGAAVYFIYCIWGNLRITVAELIAAVPSGRRMPLDAAIANSDSVPSGGLWAYGSY